MKKILVADDNESIREIIRIHLSSLGTFEVYEAENGRKAVELFKAVCPDLVFMDLFMPRMSGWQAIEAIRAVEKGKRTPVVAWTCMTEEESTLKGDWKISGFDEFLHKGRMDPWSLKDVLSRFGVSEGEVSA